MWLEFNKEKVKLILADMCAVSGTVLDTKEKPTRPPPRKLKLTTKPPATSQVKSTTTASTSMLSTMGTTGTTSTTSTTGTMSTSTMRKTMKPKWKSTDKKLKKTKKLGPRIRNKAPNKQAASMHMKNTTLRQKSTTQSRNPMKNPSSDKVKVKAKTTVKADKNQTAIAMVKKTPLKMSNNLKDNRIHTKKKIPPQKGVQQPRHEKNRIKTKPLVKENEALRNKTKTNLNVKSNRTM